jgi:hypothetical protein
MSYYSRYEHACKNLEYLHVQIFVNICHCIRVLVILHNRILHKCEFDQAHCIDLTKRSSTKFSLPFLDIPISFYEFWKFATISGIKEI